MVSVVGNANTKDGLLNIRLQIETIINQFKDLSEENEEVKNLLKTLEGTLEDVDKNISASTNNMVKLEQLTQDIQQFKSAVTDTFDTNLSAQDRGNQIEVSDVAQNTIRQAGGTTEKDDARDISNVSTWLEFLPLGMEIESLVFSSSTHYNIKYNLSKNIPIYDVVLNLKLPDVIKIIICQYLK